MGLQGERRAHSWAVGSSQWSPVPCILQTLIRYLLIADDQSHLRRTNWRLDRTRSVDPVQSTQSSDSAVQHESERYSTHTSAVSISSLVHSDLNAGFLQDSGCSQTADACTDDCAFHIEARLLLQRTSETRYFGRASLDERPARDFRARMERLLFLPIRKAVQPLSCAVRLAQQPPALHWLIFAG